MLLFLIFLGFSMNLKSLIKFFFLVNIWPGKLEKDGCIKITLVNIKTLIISCVYAVGASLYIWRYTVPELMRHSEWSFVGISMFFCNQYPLTQATHASYLSLALRPLDGWRLNLVAESMDITSKVAWISLGVLATLAGILLQMPEFLPSDDPILWVSMTFLLVPFILATYCVYITPLVEIAMLKSELLEVLEKQSTTTDIQHTIRTVQRTCKAFSYHVSFILTSTQIFLIISIYIAVLNIRYTNIFLFVFSVITTVLMTMGDLEECYDLIKEVSDKAREEACGKASVKEMMQLMVAAGKLEDTYPFSALKFFTFERSTVTAMLATTLTYLVVLIQSIPN
jgi:hypothetical protein